MFFWRIYLGTLLFLLVTFFTTIFVVNALIPADKFYDQGPAVTQLLKDSLQQHGDQKALARQVHLLNQIQDDMNLSLLKLDALAPHLRQGLMQSANGVIRSKTNIQNPAVYYLLPASLVLKAEEQALEPFETLNDWLDLILPLMLVFAALAFGLFLLIRKLSQPLRQLTVIADELGKGNLAMRAATDFPKPVNTLANGFNSMAERLQQSMREQQIMIGAIPHELRSPLGRIRFALDLSRNAKTVEALRQHIEKIDAYVDDMQQTVDEILELNRLQDKQSIDQKALSICKLLDSLLITFRQNYPNIHVVCQCEHPVMAQGNASLLKHALQNLLENASQYTASEITISVSQENGKTTMQVDDDGTGIAENKLNEIFMPFSTTDRSRNRSTGGVGLGLALVKMIMQKHGGTVSASNNSQGGARFKIVW